MRPADKIPEKYRDILPICPCGCESQMAGEREEYVTPWYVDRIRKDKLLADRSDLNCERAIIAQRNWKEAPLIHHMRHIRHLFPWVTHDPNLVRLVDESLKCENDGRRLMHMIGHASSGKTNFMVLDAFRMVDIFPYNSECFVASPYRSASEYLLWSAFNEVADQLKACGRIVHKKANVISYGSKRNAGPGVITLVSFHAVGVLRGKKLVDQDTGYLGVFLDEAGEFVNDAILHIIANLKSQRGFRMRTGTNFRSITGLDGKFNQPQNLAWTELSRELSYRWDSVNGGRTIRMRAKRSPNIVIGKDYYPYLLRGIEHDDLLEYGVDSPYYLSQGDAFPSVKSISRLILSESDIQGGGSYELVNFRPNTEEKYAFADPSFTLHGDCSVVAAGALGTVDNVGSFDQKIRADGLHEIAVDEGRTWDSELLDLANDLRGEKGLKDTFIAGDKIEPYDLNAILVGKYLLENKIPFNNFGFDDSMRGQVTASYIYFLGEGVESVYYGNKATNKASFPPEFKWVTDKKTGKRFKVRMTCEEMYINLVSQMWLVTAAMIKSGHVRDAFQVQKALDQMQLRLKAEPKANVASSVRRLAIESKDEFKDRNRNQSPDHADAWCGLVWMIVDRRLTPKQDVGDASRRGNYQVAQYLLDRAAEGLKRGKRFPRRKRS